MKHYTKRRTSIGRLIATVALIISFYSIHAQVELRDTLLNWQHHQFELNEDYSMKSYSTNSSDIQQVTFSQAKVIENSLIRLVLVPEYGGRVISHVYKPTGFEYLYQSECGTPYGMNDGNFYYDWLMVYGGIFPTFPEPEHGKTWLVPWDFEILTNNEDSVVVKMAYTDSTSYSGKPGGFNNGITGITCEVIIGVYEGSSSWDYDVKLINNKSSVVNYEYWTCTALTPGSTVGNTGNPLNSEIVVPIETYEAAWSPGGWIGNYGSNYSYDNIRYFSDWANMGIAYANALEENYWGVINHENQEGVFRISPNDKTPGMKFWTWGKDNMNNDMFSFQNGGADNYIELWGGVSQAFFTDATLAPNDQIAWKETYAATTNMKVLDAINELAAVGLFFDDKTMEISYALNSFQPENAYTVNFFLDGDAYVGLDNKTVEALELGELSSYSLSGEGILPGNYTANFELLDPVDNSVLLSASKAFEVSTVSITPMEGDEDLRIQVVNGAELIVQHDSKQLSSVQIYSINGRLIQEEMPSSNTFSTTIGSPGVYIVHVTGDRFRTSEKVVIF